MGVWGTGPFDNDDAGDMIAKLDDPIRMVNKAKSNDSAADHYYLARAAAEILLFTHDILGGPSLEPALMALKRMRNDKEWLSHWKNRRRIIAALDKQIAAVETKLNTCCRPKMEKRNREEVARSRNRLRPLPRRRRTKRLSSR